jgi:ribosomal protein L37AE/L43A
MKRIAKTTKTKKCNKCGKETERGDWRREGDTPVWYCLTCKKVLGG